MATSSGTAYRDVLVVEDEPALSTIIGRNLRSRGVGVREAASVGQAIIECSKQLPDLLLLDINLPDRTGWDLIRLLRDRHMEVPTIILSAVRVPASRLEEFRPLAYLPKPFPLDALIRLVIDPEPAEENAG